MEDFDKIINHLQSNYRDAEYIELEVRYKFLVDEVVNKENAFRDDWINNNMCGCIFNEYRDSCDHLKKAIKKNKVMKANREALCEIAMKMFHKTNNGLYFLTAQQFK